MSKIEAISKTTFQNKSWRRPADYIFASSDSVCALTALELPQAIMHMPTGFVLADNVYSLVAVQSLQPDTNHYVDTSGNWIGKYVPEIYQYYPFLLAKNAKNEEQLVFCVDSDSDLVTEGSTGEIFFDDAGDMCDALTSIFESLSRNNEYKAATAKICESLCSHGLLKPWDLEVQLDSGMRRVEGLYCIDEQAVNALSDEAFLELRKSGALIVVYCQLLSIQHIPELVQLLKDSSKSAAHGTGSKIINDAITGDDNITFDNL